MISLKLIVKAFIKKINILKNSFRFKLRLTLKLNNLPMPFMKRNNLPIVSTLNFKSGNETTNSSSISWTNLSSVSPPKHKKSSFSSKTNWTQSNMNLPQKTLSTQLLPKNWKTSSRLKSNSSKTTMKNSQKQSNSNPTSTSDKNKHCKSKSRHCKMSTNLCWNSRVKRIWTSTRFKHKRSEWRLWEKRMNSCWKRSGGRMWSCRRWGMCHCSWRRMRTFWSSTRRWRGRSWDWRRQVVKSTASCYRQGSDWARQSTNFPNSNRYQPTHHQNPPPSRK